MLDFMSPYDLFRYAEAMFERGEYRPAQEALERLLGTSDDHTGLVAARLLLARTYYHTAQLGRAEKLARAILEEAPTEAYAALLLGRTLQRTGNKHEGLRYVSMAESMGQSVR